MSDPANATSLTPSSFTHGKRLPFVIVAAVLGRMAAGFGAAQDPIDKKEKAAQEYVNPHKGKPEELRKLALIGPEGQEFVTLEPDGMRIRLPAGFEGARPMHGVNSGMIVKGDFEITAMFEVLREPGLGEAGDKGTMVHLLVTANKPPFDLAGFSRHVKGNAPTKYTAWRNQTDEATRKNKQKFKGFDVKGTKKQARNSKFESAEQLTQSARSTRRKTSFVHSDFVLRICFGFRNTDFGFGEVDG